MGVLYEVLDCGHHLVRPGHREICDQCRLEARIAELEAKLASAQEAYVKADGLATDRKAQLEAQLEGE